jgi:hypothetical protein
MAENYVDSLSEGWRFKCGLGLICLVALSWALVPLASAAGVSGAQMATLVGVLFISNKVLLIAAIAVMGKAGFQQLKARLHKHVKAFMAWPAEVSVARHRVGVVLFCIPVLAAFLDHQMDMFAPQLAPYKLQIRLVGDVMLIASVFMLGANFWEKLRALFIRDAKVATP